MCDLKEINNNNFVYKTYSNGLISPFYAYKNISFKNDTKKGIVCKRIDKSILNIILKKWG